MNHRTRLNPRFAAICLAIAVAGAGAAGGAAIGSSPVLKRADSAVPTAQRNAGVGDFELDTSEPLPDHYPLVTPSGTIPVAALAAHGRFRGERQSWADRPDYVAQPDTGSWGYSEDEINQLEIWEPRRAPVTRTAMVEVHRQSSERVEVVAVKPSLSKAESGASIRQEPPSRPSSGDIVLMNATSLDDVDVPTAGATE